jgi:hypothetical protein
LRTSTCSPLGSSSYYQCHYTDRQILQSLEFPKLVDEEEDVADEELLSMLSNPEHGVDREALP